MLTAVSHIRTGSLLKQLLEDKPVNYQKSALYFVMFHFQNIIWKICYWYLRSIFITGLGEEETSDSHTRFDLNSFTRPCCKVYKCFPSRVLAALHLRLLHSNSLNLFLPSTRKNKVSKASEINFVWHLGVKLINSWYTGCFIQGNKRVHRRTGIVDNEFSTNRW